MGIRKPDKFKNLDRGQRDRNSQVLYEQNIRHPGGNPLHRSIRRVDGETPEGDERHLRHRGSGSSTGSILL